MKPAPDGRIWTCTLCGALVAGAEKATHEEWHETLSRRLESALDGAAHALMAVDEG